MITDPMLQPRPGSFVKFRNLITFSAVFSLILQIIIVSYNVYTGYVRVSGVAEYLGRIIYSTLLSTVLGLFLITPDFFIIKFLNRKYPWAKGAVRRGLTEFVLIILTGGLIGAIGTAGADAIHHYNEPFREVLINNILIAAVINIILVTGLEAWFFFREGRHSKIRTEKLRQELATVKFEVLKNQINPHFLFNCLNVLSGLIDTDTKKAQEFIDAFAMIYHYVLDTIEKPVVTLQEEISFARSYIYLQQIRHGEQLKISISIDSEKMKMLMPPLSLQLVLENIMKHNNTAGDLDISITSEDQVLVISNEIRAKTSAVRSTGVGQKNLVKRYSLISGKRPDFRISGTRYVVHLPLIEEF